MRQPTDATLRGAPSMRLKNTPTHDLAYIRHGRPNREVP